MEEKQKVLIVGNDTSDAALAKLIEDKTDMSVGVVENAPTPFELEYPEAGQALMELCQERGAVRARGKRNKPLNLGEEPIVRDTPKIGRNDPCPCGSGKKYKRCCGAYEVY